MLKILPPMWFMLFFGAALLLHFFVPESRIFSSWFPYSTAVGFAVFAAGFFLPMWASKIFAEEKTEIVPTSPGNRVLIVRGPFRFSRNPMYLGMTIMLLGIAIIVGTMPVFIAAAAFFGVMNFVFIPFEEEKMARQFGDSYTAYRTAVRRWI